MSEEKDIDLDEFDELVEETADDGTNPKKKTAKKPIAKKFHDKSIYDENRTLNMELFMDIMSSDIRRRILEKLAKAPRYLADLESELSVTKQAVKKHLKILMDVGLVETDSDYSEMTEGSKIFYRIKKDVNISLHIDITPNYWNFSNTPFRYIEESLESGEFPFGSRIAPLLLDFVRRSEFEKNNQKDIKDHQTLSMDDLIQNDENRTDFIIVDKLDSDFNILKYKMDENLTEEQAQKLREALARKIWNPNSNMNDRFKNVIAGLIGAGNIKRDDQESSQDDDIDSSSEAVIRERIQNLKADFIDALKTIINVDDFINQYDTRRTEFIKYKIWILGRIKRKIGAVFHDDMLSALILYNLLFEYEHFHDAETNFDGIIKSIVLEKNPDRAGIRKDSKEDQEEFSEETKKKIDRILTQLKIMLDELEL